MSENHNDPASSAVKPAWKSTEFLLSTLATVIGMLLASGLLSSSDPQQAKILQILGMVATTLAALGYTAMRTSAKNTVAEGAAAIAIEKVRASVPTKPA